jgi:hypothetical protein
LPRAHFFSRLDHPEFFFWNFFWDEASPLILWCYYISIGFCMNFHCAFSNKMITTLTFKFANSLMIPSFAYLIIQNIKKKEPSYIKAAMTSQKIIFHLKPSQKDGEATSPCRWKTEQ